MAQNVQRLVVCFDGTWNTERSNTNVSRLFRKIADENTGCPDQRRFYDEGVGTKWGERVRGGALGMGLDRNIRQGYAWLASQFPLDPAAPMDEEGFVCGPDIFLLGFSRGAFTARSLGGLINYLGLPRSRSMPAPAKDGKRVPLEDHEVIKKAWELYTQRPMPAARRAIADGSASAELQQKVAGHDLLRDAFRKDHALFPTRIHFMGVWDTVGALGIPRVFDYSWAPRPSNRYRFHDTALGRCVRFAFHAVAIDEHREPYCVTLWTGREDSTKEVEQRWFSGAHGDVGGGYEDDLLPDPPLAWIAQKAADKGLHFVNDRGVLDPATGTPCPSVAQPPAAFDLDGREYLSPVHDSYAEFMLGAYRLLRSLPGGSGRAYRRMLVEEDGIGQTIDATAYRKLEAESSYRPPNLAQAGRQDVSYHRAVLDEEASPPPAAAAGHD